MMQAHQQLSGGWKPYSYKFLFCCACASKVSPPKAIKSFFCCQNVIDLMSNTGAVYFMLSPPGSGASIVAWVIYILMSIMALCTVVGFVVSCMARSELKTLMLNGKGSSPIGKTTLALNLMTVALGITVFFYMSITLICFYIFLFASSSGNPLLAALGTLILIIGLIVLLMSLTWVSQLCQAIKLRSALEDCKSDNMMAKNPHQLLEADKF